MFKVIALIVVLLSVMLVSAEDGPLNAAACVRIIRGICQGGVLDIVNNAACTQACIAQNGLAAIGVCLNLSPLNLGASVCVCLSAPLP